GYQYAAHDAELTHVYKVAAAGGAAVDIPFFGRAADFVAAGSARNVAAAGSKGFENRIEVFDDLFFAANHLAITAFEPPDATAGADVAVMNSFRGEFLGAAKLVDIRGVAAVDADVIVVELGNETLKRCVYDSCGNHQPDGARLLKLLHKIIERVRAGRALTRKLFHRFRAAIVHNARVPF